MQAAPTCLSYLSADTAGQEGLAYRLKHTASQTTFVVPKLQLVIETQKDLLLRSLFWFVGLVEPLLLYYDRYNIQNKLTNANQGLKNE